MKMSSFAFLIAVVALFSSSVVADYTLAFLSDYDTQVFYLFYNNSGPAPTSTEAQISTQSGGALGFNTLSTDSSSTNYISCPDASQPAYDYKYCMVYMRELSDWEYQTEEAVTVTFRSGVDEVDAEYLGRNINFMSGTLPDASSQGSWGGMSPALGISEMDLGWKSVPNSISFAESGGNLEQFQLGFDGGSVSATLGFLSTSVSLGSAQSFSNPSVQSVTVSYTSDDLVCGLALVLSTGSDLSGGCTTNSQTFTMSSGFNFAGFVTLRASGSYLLIPLEYQLLGSRVAYYVNEDSASSDFYLRFFWNPNSYSANWQIMDDRHSSGNVMTTSYQISSTSVNNALVSPVSAITDDMDRACTEITMNSAVTYTDDKDRAFESTATFVGWTSGYTEVASTTVAVASVTGTQTTFSSANRVDGVQTSCVRTLAQDTQFGISGGVLYANGWWMGSDQGAAPSLNSPSGNVDSVNVYYSGSTLNGLIFLSGGSTVLSVGTTTGTSGTTSPSDSNAVLGYIETTMVNAATVSLTFHWMRPAAPWNFFMADIPDQSTQFYAGNGFASSEELDGDLQEIRFWQPFDASSGLTLDLTGPLGRSLLDSVSLSTNGLTKGASYTRTIYGVVAQSNYTFDMYGTDSDINELSLTSAEQKFDSPNAARLRCEIGGTMVYQIEFEGVPEILVSHRTGVATTFGTSPGTSSAASDTSQQMVCGASDCFQYPSDASYPLYDDFVGYPKRITLYSVDTNNYLKGMTVFYEDVMGNDATYQLAGESGDSQLSGYTEYTLDLTTASAARISGYNYGTNTNNQLSAIQFLDVNGNNIGGCLGVTGSTCSTNGARASGLTNIVSGSTAAEYFISGFTVTVDSDQSTNPGIYGLQATYTYMKWPTLLSADRSDTANCQLGFHPDYFFVRNSAWSFSYSLNTNNLFCGTIQEIYSIGDGATKPIEDEFDHSVVYYQIVTRAQDTIGGSTAILDGTNVQVVRGGASWQAEAYCYYNASGDVDSSFDTMGEAAQSMSGINQFKYEMQLALDDTFNTYYTLSSTPTMLVGEPVYVRVSMTNAMGFEGYTVVTTDCWATKVPDPTVTDRYELEEARCSSDTTFTKLTPSNAAADAEYFTFDSFAWYESGASTSGQVYLHCDVIACPGSDTSVCDQTCSTTKRMRREAASLASLETSEVKRAVVSTVQPFFVREKRAASANNGNQLEIMRDSSAASRYSNVAYVSVSLFALLATVSFFAVLSLFIYRFNGRARGTGYNRLPENAQI